MNDIHYYELCFYHDEDDRLATKDRCSYCIKTEIPPVISPETALHILFHGHPESEAEMAPHLTSVFEIAKAEADGFYDMSGLSIRVEDENGSYYAREESIIDLERIEARANQNVETIMGRIEALRAEREKENPALTQEYLANQAGISLAAYQAYCSGADHDVELIPVLKMVTALDGNAKEILATVPPQRTKACPLDRLPTEGEEHK